MRTLTKAVIGLSAAGAAYLLFQLDVECVDEECATSPNRLCTKSGYPCSFSVQPLCSLCLCG